MKWKRYRYDKMEWHPWFSWYPVRSYDHSEDGKDFYIYYWLTWVERKLTFYGYYTEIKYRLPFADKETPGS